MAGGMGCLEVQPMNLDHLLKPEHRQAGLHLEDDEDFIYMTQYHYGLAIWRSNIDIEIILEEADRYLRLSTGRSNK